MWFFTSGQGSQQHQCQVDLLQIQASLVAMLRQGIDQLPFFSSSLADVALRLGPYMSISCQKDICTRTQLVHKSRQIKTNQQTHRTNNHDDPQIPQPDLRFVKRKQQTRQKRGKAQTNNHKEDLPKDTADSPLCHYTKACKMNYPPRHS